jgi:hypothetical protein
MKEGQPKYSRDKLETQSHEDAGFEGGCPFPHAIERMDIRDRLLNEAGLDPEERDDIFRT